MKPLNVLSLFDGISCGRVALDRAGIPVGAYYASEIDKYAIMVSKSNYPDIQQIGDVNNVKGNDAPCAIDLVMGGSPCQGLSRSNNGRLNLEDPRSALFYEYIRVVRETSCKYFLLENVVCDATTKRIIDEETGVRGIMINSSGFSAQNRPRIYWTNIPGVSKIIGNSTATLSSVYNPQYDNDASLHVNLTEEEELKRQSYVLAPKTTKCCLAFNLGTGRQGQRVYGLNGKAPCLQAVGGNKAGAATVLINAPNCVRRTAPEENELLQTLPAGYTDVAGLTRTQRYRGVGNGWTVDVIANILRGIA